ncbi:hypothetical protein QQ020_18180 [Fulvivirgaceae bacterium BMA12]|uniref:Lipoprotein n=1 Tax=Agaribacillus aureus TaxID=3051825 RepID=A0ABT8LB57_9BACT|nr:hypothetical protein [Fulvivirgaceae bacterium BMA12]
MSTLISCNNNDDSGPSPKIPFTISLMGIDNTAVSVTAILENNQSVFKRKFTLLRDQQMARLMLEGIPDGFYKLRLLINEGKVNIGALTHEANIEVNVAINGSLKVNAPFYQDVCCVSIEWKGRYYYEHRKITGIFSSNPCEGYAGLLDNCKPIGHVSYLYVDKVIYDANDKILKEAVFECFDCTAEEENIVRCQEEFQSFYQLCKEEDWVTMDSMIRIDYGPKNDGVTMTSFYQKWKK